MASILITFVTLAIATGYEGDFSSSRVFSALALFNQLTIALFIFPITVPITISAIISTRRLETFMALPDVQKEVDGSQNVARVLSRGDNLLDIYENEDHSDTEEKENTTHAEESSPAEVVQEPVGGHRGKSKLRKSSLSLYSQLERNRVRKKTPSKDLTALTDQQTSISDSTVFRINNGVFTWSKNHLNAINLTIEHLQVNKGEFKRFISFILLCLYPNISSKNFLTTFPSSSAYIFQLLCLFSPFIFSGGNNVSLSFVGSLIHFGVS